MDSLSNSLKPIFKNFQIQQKIKQESNNPLLYDDYSSNNNNFDNYEEDEDFDDQNYEMYKLIQKAKNYDRKIMKEKRNYPRYNGTRYSNGDNLINRYPTSFRNNRRNYYQRMSYDNNYHDLKRRNGNYPFNEDIDDEYNTYIRSIPLEKNISRNRIKKIENINDDNYYYNNEPMIYYQREPNQIKNSYMNESLGLPQTSQKIEYPNRRNNLIFSSNKISFKKINYNNINQSIDLLFSK